MPSAIPTQPEKKSQSEKDIEKPKLIWSDYQQRQLNTFVDMGFMTKIEENEEDMNIEVAEDDGLFNEDESDHDNNNSSRKSSSSE